MKKYFVFLSFLSLFAALWLLPTSARGSDEKSGASSIRLFLSEVQPASMAVDQYCTVVFSDHRFHSEKASLHHGKDTDRKVFEGSLSDEQWNSLSTILDSKELRDLKIPPYVPPLVMQETHPYSISIARERSFQNLEFLDSKSLKPYKAEISPLLQWWKVLRGEKMKPSNAPASERCSLDKSHSIVGQ